VLCQVLESFAYAMPGPREAGASGDLGMSVWAGLPGGQGWLALRSNHVFAQRLAQDAAGEDDPALAGDAFTELCNLAVSHLSSRMGLDRQGDYHAFVPLPGLPQGHCLSQVLMDVDGEPLEASFWRPQ
jgi:hypothetical protein